MVGVHRGSQAAPVEQASEGVVQGLVLEIPADRQAGSRNRNGKANTKH